MRSSIGVYLQLIVTDKKGKIVRKTRFKRSKSFVLQFLQMLEVQMYPSVNVTIKDYLNANNSVPEDETTFKSELGVGVDNKGIAVGTGTTAATSNDYALETAIAHGVGAGELSYGATSKTTTAVVGVNVDFVLTRTFNNGSGAGINVTEAGILGSVTIAGPVTKYNLMIRDVFSAVAVANGQTLTVNYTFRTTV